MSHNDTTGGNGRGLETTSMGRWREIGEEVKRIDEGVTALVDGLNDIPHNVWGDEHDKASDGMTALKDTLEERMFEEHPEEADTDVFYGGPSDEDESDTTDGDRPPRGQPVNEIDRVTRSQHIVENCVVCGQTHYHGNANPTKIGQLSHRAAHCTSSSGGYYIALTEDTEGLEHVQG